MDTNPDWDIGDYSLMWGSPTVSPSLLSQPGDGSPLTPAADLDALEPCLSPWLSALPSPVTSTNIPDLYPDFSDELLQHSPCFPVALPLASPDQMPGASLDLGSNQNTTVILPNDGQSPSGQASSADTKKFPPPEADGAASTSPAGSRTADRPAKLRTLNPGRRRSSASGSEGLDARGSLALQKHRRDRNSHNQVEKKYRSRLNGQFERLLTTLPSVMVDEDGPQAISKARVLELARLRIQALEKENETLRMEGRRLLNSVVVAQDMMNLMPVGGALCEGGQL